MGGQARRSSGRRQTVNCGERATWRPDRAEGRLAQRPVSDPGEGPTAQVQAEAVFSIDSRASSSAEPDDAPCLPPINNLTRVNRTPTPLKVFSVSRQETSTTAKLVTRI